MRHRHAEFVKNDNDFLLRFLYVIGEGGEGWRRGGDTRVKFYRNSHNDT